MLSATLNASAPALPLNEIERIKRSVPSHTFRMLSELYAFWNGIPFTVECDGESYTFAANTEALTSENGSTGTFFLPDGFVAVYPSINGTWGKDIPCVIIERNKAARLCAAAAVKMRSSFLAKDKLGNHAGFWSKTIGLATGTVFGETVEALCTYDASPSEIFPVSPDVQQLAGFPLAPSYAVLEKDRLYRGLQKETAPLQAKLNTLKTLMNATKG